MLERFVGQPLARVDGRAKVTGAATYAAEFNQPGQAYAVIVTSAIAAGRIVAIDDSGARALPGVLAVISHANAPQLPYEEHRTLVDPAVGERLHVFQDDRVRFFGQPIAVVVATTQERAEHAATLVRVRYATDKPSVRFDAPDAQTIVPEAGKIPGARIQADYARGTAETALDEAAVRVDATYGIARHNHNPIEPHATIAAWNGGALTLWSKSQFVANEAAEIGAVFGLPAGNVTVICPYVGGAFGTSLRSWPHVTVAALAARRCGRPVKLALTRRQMFFATGHRPQTLQRCALGATPNGRLTSIIHEATAETSRHEQFIEAITAPSTFMYGCPNVRTRYRLAPLDLGTPNHMRGPGEACGMFALECAMDELAVALGVDPVTLRLRNEPAIDEGTGRPFSSRSLRACYERGAEAFGWSRRDRKPGSMRDGGLVLGWGMAAATYPANMAPANARARLLADGTAEVEAAASDMGPGTYTTITQVAADALGLPPEHVRFRLGRSGYPATPPHGGSLTTASVGSAVRAACLAVREQAASTSRRPLEASATSKRGDAARNFSMHAFGAIFVEVAVDIDLATARVRRIVGAYAAGRIVNPRLAHSQCTGGMVGGIGMALMERTVIDPHDGRPVNASLADYLVPVNLDIDSLEALFVEEEDPHVNPLGVKGLGEIALVGTAPAIANAVFHATGKRVRNLPIRIEDLL
jgi:xanthine dehydrogenase YagR molybdenum-binding subunit